MDNRFKTVVFDLDGTIYQNNTFHRDYMGFLLEGTAYEGWQEPLSAFIDQVYLGRRLVMNAYYRVSLMDPASPEELCRRLEDARLPEMDYDTALDRDDCLYLGDAWAVVTFIGRALGLLEGERQDRIYRQIRRKMSQDGLQGNRRLRSAISRLGESCTTVLLTNSYEETAVDFLRQLGFQDAFRQAVYSAGKPRGLAENLMSRCPDLATDPGSVLAVGDHAFNDLMPLQRLGCKALWINPFRDIHEPACDWSVHTLDELACCLEEICR